MTKIYFDLELHMSINNQLSSTASNSSYPQKSEKYVANRKKYRRYNWMFFLSVFLPIVTVGIFNIVVDPYDVFNTPNFLGINHSKPRKDNNDRLFKATDVIRIKPITVLMGSSKTKQGLDTNYPALKNEQPAYNLGLNAITAYELRRYLEHSIANQQELSLAIIGLDFLMFNSFTKRRGTFAEYRLKKQYISPKDIIHVALSMNGVLASKKTIIDSNKTSLDDIPYEANGFMPVLNPDPDKTKDKFQYGINNYFNDHAKYKLSTPLIELKKIVDLCQKNQVKLIVFISPSHATQWEAIRATGEWSTFEEWKREVVKITPVFDFSGYNSITIEPIHSGMENYRDNFHYTKKVGDLVLNRILSYKEEEVPEDFGILINQENIESHLEKIRQHREVWANNNSNEVKLVEEIKQKYDGALN
ncbi:hypothetical protein [Okeania sp. SIO1F9]|uniref:hypothetical protein n=1 Tax=Okeania sp. SIO1F9 TaxID=2607813 RepID=UPI00257FEFBE|nr:hypothetical protein [Okeania sp. SIO1F9]